MPKKPFTEHWWWRKRNQTVWKVSLNVSNTGIFVNSPPSRVIWVNLQHYAVDFRQTASSSLQFWGKFLQLPQFRNQGQTTTLREMRWSLTVNQYRKNVGDGTYGLSSISEKTNHLQMSLLRQQILLLFEDPECWSGPGLEPSTSPSTFQHSITWTNQGR